MKDGLGDVQSVLVLGGTSEIAQAIVRKLAGRGRLRAVVLACRRPDDATAFAEEIAAMLPHAVTTVTPFDADDIDSHAAFVERVVAGHGDLDLVVLAFGVLGDQAELTADHRAAAAVAHTNFTGAVSISLVIAEQLRHQGHGTLVILSSVAGERVRAANFVYGATKAGLDGFAQGLGDSLRGSGARVMTVRPGFVRTRMTAGMKEAPFTTGPDAVAGAVVAGLSSGAPTVWSPPILRYVFSVLRHLPRPLWRRMPG